MLDLMKFFWVRNCVGFICRRVAALQERESHGASRSDSKLKGPSPGKGQYKGMSQTDIEIQQRLEKLKEKSPKEGTFYYFKHKYLRMVAVQ